MRWVFFGVAALSALACTTVNNYESAKGGSAGEPRAAGEVATGGSGGSGGKTGGGGSSSGESGESGSPSGGAESGGSASMTGGTGAGGEGGDEGCTVRTFYRDNDGDGYGVDSDTVSACEAPSGYAGRGGDCADERGRQLSINRNPGMPELCNADDENCNDEIDEDGACAAGCKAEVGSGDATCLAPHSWNDALATCESMSMTMQPVDPFRRLGGEYWTGAHKVNGEWEFVDGTAFPLAGYLWATGEPSGDGECVMSRDSDNGHRSAGLAAVDCSLELPFGCQPGN